MPSSACDWSSDVCSSDRSEEHTSELQSRSDLVCRLLLEKKKKNELDDHKSTAIDALFEVRSYVMEYLTLPIAVMDVSHVSLNTWAVGGLSIGICTRVSNVSV